MPNSKVICVLEDEFIKEHLDLIDEYCVDMATIERAIYINANVFTSTQRDILFTHSIAMLYSIWEGFVTKSFSLYIDFINGQGISYDRLNGNLLIYIMEHRFKQFKEYPEKDNKKTKFFTELYAHCQSGIPQIEHIVDTEDNVGFEVLNKLLKAFGLKEFNERWKSYNYPRPTLKDIMKTFLIYRNAVAHGGDISNEEAMTQDKYNIYRTLIRDLMYGMHERFLDGISEKTYMKG